MVTSLSFVTNKNTHGTFGQASDSHFSIPWCQGSLVGFYGFAGHYIDGIGVYVKAYEEIMRIGTWGSTKLSTRKTYWSLQLQKNHHLTSIVIDHGNQINSLQMIYAPEHGGSLDPSNLAAGWYGGVTREQIKLKWKEEIRGIEGTFGLAKSDKPDEPDIPNLIIITSLSFVTNERTIGPYGVKRGTHFEVKWDDCSFVGFYGIGGFYIDSIGVYMKATTL